MLRLTPCVADDAALVGALLAAGMPVVDLGDDDACYFTLSGGFGGLAGAGADRLLRSIVVPAEARRSCTGSRIVNLLADYARADGAARLWLLTTDAAGFFARLGWVEADRSSAPDTIRATRQFAGLCPASASLMVRAL